MREIKFRMWDLENKAMIDGDSLAFEEYAPISHLLTQEGIMQYTGLKDKNGKEIYEGDLLGADWLTAPVIVKWHENGHWVVEGLNGWDEHLCAYKDIAVVGNIYEHPHLLEPKSIESTASRSGAEADHDPT